MASSAGGGDAGPRLGLGVRPEGAKGAEDFGVRSGVRSSVPAKVPAGKSVVSPSADACAEGVHAALGKEELRVGEPLELRPPMLRPSGPMTPAAR